jgi:hypothetical protein
MRSGSNSECCESGDMERIWKAEIATLSMQIESRENKSTKTRKEHQYGPDHREYGAGKHNV